MTYPSLDDTHCNPESALSPSRSRHAAPRRRRLTLLAVLILLVALAALPASANPVGLTTRVSIASDATQGDGASFGPAVSANGRYVTFGSEAGNLVPNDTTPYADIFVYDRQTFSLERFSVALGGGSPDAPVEGPAISADGRFVARVAQSAKPCQVCQDIAAGRRIRVSGACSAGVASSASGVEVCFDHDLFEVFGVQLGRLDHKPDAAGRRGGGCGRLADWLEGTARSAKRPDDLAVERTDHAFQPLPVGRVEPSQAGIGGPQGRKDEIDVSVVAFLQFQAGGGDAWPCIDRERKGPEF